MNKRNKMTIFLLWVSIAIIIVFSLTSVKQALEVHKAFENMVAELETESIGAEVVTAIEPTIEPTTAVDMETETVEYSVVTESEMVTIPDDTGDVLLTAASGDYFVNNDEFLAAVPAEVFDQVTSVLYREVLGTPTTFTFDSFVENVLTAHDDTYILTVSLYDGEYMLELTTR